RASATGTISVSAGPTETYQVVEHSETAEDSMLIADPCNNRVVETNPAGKVVWELKSFQDPFRLLPPGEPLTLAEPMDAQRWVDLESTAGGPALLVIHTLVADAGNTRVLEIVDKIRYRQGNFTPDSY